jgi:hypothetical protein
MNNIAFELSPPTTSSIQAAEFPDISEMINTAIAPEIQSMSIAAIAVFATLSLINVFKR